MALSNKDRVGQSLDLLAPALEGYFQNVVTGEFGQSAWDYALKESDRHGTSANVDITRLMAIFHNNRQPISRSADQPGTRQEWHVLPARGRGGSQSLGAW